MGKIYKIINDINQKIYIGQTIRSLATRFAQHKYDATHENSSHYDSVLYRAMRKYGIEHFYIVEIEEVSNLDLNERERYWIAYYNSYYNGYNATLGGDNGNYKYTDEQILEVWQNYYTLEDMSNALECNRHTLADRLSSLIPNYKQELKEKLLLKHQTGDSTKKIRELWDMGKTPQEICECLQIERHTPKRHLVNYENFSEDEWNRRIRIQRSKSNTQKKTIIGLSIVDSTSMSFGSVTAAAEFLGNKNKASNISACLNGRQKTAYGYRWKYVDQGYHLRRIIDE